jgi:hypothetical protein
VPSDSRRGQGAQALMFNFDIQQSIDAVIVALVVTGLLLAGLVWLWRTK